MKRVRTYGTLIALALALAAITATTVATVNHGAQHAACTIVTPAGGAVVGMSLVVMLIAGRALMRQVRREADHAGQMIERHSCPECEREVHGAWRMCPYCGAMVDGPRASKKGEVPA
ncbi:MAG: hypothetical protein JXP37_10535 [Coriobacteriia bacterium]|nr:hypothetical protein [Coriobacteriia bacterium]